ncbi:MAG: hypothetical protein PHR66_11220 [Desulfuromonadaceae bacterium]|nr:hypothetical protein [Desulfuromonadaceae bacterium]
MKKTTTLYAATVLVAFSFTGQAFANGGSIGGGHGHGNTGGTHQMASTMLPASGSGMHQRTMKGNESQHGPATGSGIQNMNQGGSGNSRDHQYGQMNGNGTGLTTAQPLDTTATN